MTRPPSVLFVCTGNICRSPTAEAVLRALAEREGVPLEVDSAGLSRYHVGEPPDARSRAVAADRGYDLDGLRARVLTEADLDGFDHVWVMDRGHLNLLRRRFGERPHVRLFLEAAAPPEVRAREVPDPYLGDRDTFERVFELIEAGSRAALERFRTKSAPPGLRGT